ncbi:M48 family metalloprotease [Marinimicrobium sp. ABcell2]|uniref:M48 family metalloprotease n=1 Tax=Marinimicrobium sp. ABcell2 TaxID=3069751 RepID=UPI0027B23A53|nr:M48 family metalloprotease [Marinimicrobium sp. ABcell2]MDQ2076951.1 M48 family metalloprotease [Marinimicrobium sp. ABcell2]
MKRIVGYLTSLLLIASIITACTVNPVTGDRQFSLMSTEQELAIGQQHYVPSQQAQGGRYVVDPELTLYVNQVGQRLAEVSDRPELPYEFVVLNNDVPNAWALPGGKMAINRGLLIHLEDEAQLAAVLGHEIVHAAARHGATQQTRNVLLQAGMLAAGVAAVSQEWEYGALAVGALGVGATAWQARYSRSHELEADRYGVDYMVRTGYDPQGAVELQETFLKFSEGRNPNWLEGLFASHPPSRERMRLNQELADENPGGARNRDAYRRATAQLRRDQPAYERYQEALSAAEKGEYGKAMGLVEQAIEHQPRENLFWELQGRLFAQDEREKDAIAAFDRAIEANPEFFRPLVYRGVLHKRQGNARQAENDLTASQKLLPTQLASYHLGELALERGARDEAIQHFRMAASGGGELGAAAERQLQQLGANAG